MIQYHSHLKESCEFSLYYSCRSFEVLIDKLLDIYFDLIFILKIFMLENLEDNRILSYKVFQTVIALIFPY